MHPLRYFYQFGMSKDETKSTPSMENGSLILGILFYEVATILWFFCHPCIYLEMQQVEPAQAGLQPKQGIFKTRTAFGPIQMSHLLASALKVLH